MINVLWGPQCRLPGAEIDLGGHRMFFVDVGAGTPVLLLHGLGWDTSLWFQAFALLGGRARLIAVDTRGHGRSTLPDGDFRIADLADDAMAVMRHLGVSRFAVAGFSQGGMTAQVLAARCGGDCLGLLVAGATDMFPPAAEKVMQARIDAFAQEGAGGAANAAAASIFSESFRAAHPDEIARFKRWRISLDQQALLRCTRSLFGFDNRSAAASITAPAYVTVGDRDNLASVEAARRLAWSLPNLRRFEVMPGGHMLPVEQPDRFGVLLDSFIDDVAGPNSPASGQP